MIARQSSGPKARVNFDCNGGSTCERQDGGCTVPSSSFCPQGAVDGDSTSYQCFPAKQCSELEIKIVFPSCWDGKSLTSDDFMSHVAYTEGDWGKYEMGGRQWRAYAAECPASHPVRIPEVQFYFRVNNYEGGQHFFSDGSAEAHADYFSGWEEAALQKVLDECENESEAASSDAWCESHFKFRDLPKKKGDERIVENLLKIQPTSQQRDYKNTVTAEAVTGIASLAGSASGTSMLIASNANWQTKPQCGLLGDKDGNGASVPTNTGGGGGGGDGGSTGGGGNNGGGGGGGGTSVCTDAYDDGSVAKPWPDFTSCAAEKPYCQDEPATLLVHCAKTCGTCTDSTGGSNPGVTDVVKCTQECNSKATRGRRPLWFAGAIAAAVAIGNVP